MLNLFFKKLSTSAEEKVNALAEDIKEKTSVSSVRLFCNDEKKPDLFCSKFGGIAYWPKNREYPVDSEGKKMQLLAQLNFSECAVKNPLLPSDGILQFFIPSHGTDYGLNMRNPVENPDFKTVYHQNVDLTVTEEDVLSLFDGKGEGNSATPVQECVAVDLVPEKCWMRINTAGFGKVFQEACKKVLKKKVSDDYQEVLDSKDFDKGIRHSQQFYRIIEEPGSRCLGYPDFCQEDVRLTKPELSPEKFDTLLLQIDSCATEEKVNFGDGGICQIFINSEDLKKKDFSKVLYNWDCN